MSARKHRTGDPVIREVYDEFLVGTDRVGRLSDPHRPTAWIESTLVVPVRP